METKRIVSLLSHFDISDEEYSFEPSPSGFIHRSGIVSVSGEPRYMLQQFNTTIFDDPEAVFRNFQIVSSYLNDPSYSHFAWIRTRTQDPYHRDEEGQLWRLLSFVQDSTELKEIRSAQEAYSCGKLLGLFHKQVAQGDAKLLKVPLPDFQDIPSRWKELQTAFQTGIPERVSSIQAELIHLDQLKDYAFEEPQGLPLRICHNDTKLSNVLFHKDSHKAICFVDLDTLMPGHLYHDFGDLARCIMSPHSEGTHQIWDQDLNSKFLSALVEGMKESGLLLGQNEIASLTYSLVSMPFLHGIRALADYLLGDQYYKVTHPDQNRFRALNLLGFAWESFLKKEELDQQIRLALNAST